MIVVVGSINRDIVVTTSRLPRPGETVLGDGYFEAPGGKGANQAVAAARLGADVKFLGCVGNDDAGRWLLDGLRDEGVDASRVLVDPDTPSGGAVIIVDDKAENIIVGLPGANGRVTVQDSWLPVIAAADVVLVQLEIPFDAVVAAAEAAIGTVILNPAPVHGFPSPSAGGLPARLSAVVDITIPNSTEAEQLGDIAVPTTIVTLGSAGAEIRTASSSRLVPAPSIAAKDTTGAGDAFCGAIAAALDRGADLGEAVVEAVHAGALSTTAPGARTAMPTRAELEAFLATGRTSPRL